MSIELYAVVLPGNIFSFIFNFNLVCLYIDIYKHWIVYVFFTCLLYIYIYIHVLYVYFPQKPVFHPDPSRASKS